MKKMLCMMLAALLLIGSALSETAAVDLPAAGELPSAAALPTATPEPAGEVYSSEDIIVTLPYGFAAMDEAAFEGYAAAVESDYPGAARTVLSAVNADQSAALSFSILDSDQDAFSAAREAAERIIGSSASVMDWQYGENRFSGFACAIGEQVYRIYYLSGETGLLTVGASAVEESAVIAMLESIEF